MIGEFIFIIFMLVIIIIVSIGDEKLKDKIYGVLICLLILVVGVYLNVVDSSFERVNDIKIVSLERGTETSGTFVLGFGSISTNIVYYAYEEIEKDTYVLQTFESSRSHPIRIVETNEITPSYRRTEWNYCEKDGWFYDCIDNFEINVKYEIFVPKGTIRKQFVG